MFQRRRFRHQLALKDRLAAWSERLEQQVTQLPRGPEREALSVKARQADIAIHLDGWARSPGLPK